MEKIVKENLSAFAAGVVKRLPKGKGTAVLVALSGELGAGKTTFMQAFARELGVTDVVQSPTYVLMKKYDLLRQPFTTLVHIDAYRLENPKEFLTLKPDEFLNDPRALVCVEWYERVKDVLPVPDFTIRFSSQDAGEGERYIEMV